jgi:superfamily II DNA or RNA helicase
MSNGDPSRTFTREAVDSWLLKLVRADWEPQFAQSTLDSGRELYLQGAITAIDLQLDQAIVSRKIQRKETYSVIEWSNGKPAMRFSTRDSELGSVIGIAGLYEIEELVGEEQMLHPIPEEVTTSKSREKESSIVESPATDPGEGKMAAPPLYSLAVVLEISTAGGLTAMPKWKKGRSLTPIYGPNSQPNLEGVDRATLLSFVAKVGQRGFSFEKRNGLFRLRKWKAVAEFAENVLPRWQKHFRILLKGDASLLPEGQRQLNWELEARSTKGMGMRVREKFHINNFKLNAVQSRRIGRARGGITFVPGQGLVELATEQLEDFEWWRRERDSGTQTQWPRYMLFSLFARKYLKAESDGGLALWQKSVTEAEKETRNLSLPAFMRPYQKEGATRLRTLHRLGCHGLLADEMGLGKTIQTLALLQKNTAKDLPDLVVCPAAVVPVWIKEVNERFPQIKVRVLGKGSLFEDTEERCLWLASYTQLRRHRASLDNVQFRYAVLDEAQLIKNPKAKVTQACVAIQAERRLALSGTPIENTPLDLWTIFRYLMPGLLGSRRELELALQENPDETADQLRNQVSPFVLRRIKAEVAKELPPKWETDLPCPLTEEQSREYRILVNGAQAEHGDDLQSSIKNAPTHIFSLLTRLRQTCCDASLLPWRKGSTPSGGKTDLLMGKLPDLIASGSKTLIFSQFTSYLAILKKLIREDLPNVPLYQLTGSTRDRGVPVKAFEETTGSAIMLASLKAAGLGVTLRTADYVFLMDPWWNPAAEEQAIARAHRIGREKPTFVYRLIAKGTVEERVCELQSKKREAFRRIIGKIEPVGTLTEHFSSLSELIGFREEPSKTV